MSTLLRYLGAQVWGWVVPGGHGGGWVHLPTFNSCFPIHFFPIFPFFLSVEKPAIHQQIGEKGQSLVTQFSEFLPTYMPKTLSWKIWGGFSCKFQKTGSLEHCQNQCLRDQTGCREFRDLVSKYPQSQPQASLFCHLMGFRPDICPWSLAQCSDSRKERGRYYFPIVGTGWLKRGRLGKVTL